MICTILAESDFPQMKIFAPGAISKRIPVSVEKTLKLLSQKPQATKNLLSTVVTKQLDLILIFWLKLSPRCLFRAGLELFDDCATIEKPKCQLLAL
jgi:hypothetical protein